MRTLCIAKSKAKALWSQPELITQPQAANPNPSGLQQKMRLVIHRVLGAHGHDKNNETMKCCVCTDTIQSNKFVLGSVNVKYSAPTRHQTTVTTRMLYWQSSTELMCRKLWRNLRLLWQHFTPSLEWPLCLPVHDLSDSDLMLSDSFVLVMYSNKKEKPWHTSFQN